jgi:hypothetical protein
MTRQPRTYAVIMGFDTHMILGAVPVLLLDTPDRPRMHQPDSTPPCRGPGPSYFHLKNPGGGS